MSENQRCQCTVHNTSSHDLINVEYGKEWGKWATPDEEPSAPPSVIRAGASGWWMLTGRQGSASGAEGWVKYQVGDVGVIQFKFDNPWGSGDNKAGCDNSSAIEYELYAATKKGDVGKSGPNTNKGDYGKEGQIPLGGSPLSLLWVLSDQS